MKTVIVDRGRGNGYAVYAVHGDQQFLMGYGSGAPLGECRWMAKMFRMALRAHDKARDTAKAKAKAKR